MAGVGRSRKLAKTYWLNLFSMPTWTEFRVAGGAVTGFRHSQRGALDRIKRGDVFLCYLTGASRWIGALEVVGPSRDKRPIWEEESFPVRFDVRPLVLLNPECGIPMEQLRGRVEFYAAPGDRGWFKGFIRRSLNMFRPHDGSLILRLLADAARKQRTGPVERCQSARRS